MMDFSLDELIRCPTKKMKTQKWRRDSGETEVGKAGTIVVDDVLASLESVAEGVPGPPAMEPKVSTQLRR